MNAISYYKAHSGLILPDSVLPLPSPSAIGYGDAGASRHKRAMKGFHAYSGSPRDDIDRFNGTLRQRGRMLRMASPLANSAVKTNRTNVVGMGLRLKSSIDRDVLRMSPEDAERWQQHTEREFAIWAENKHACDATGVNDFYAQQQLALMSWLESGDVFGLFKQYESTNLYPYSLRVHLIEADRISTPGNTYRLSAMGLSNVTCGRASNGNLIFDGVEVDGNGMIVAYYIRNTYPSQFSYQPTEWTRVEAYGAETGLPNIMQVMDSERPDQYRGVSYLAPVIEPLLQLRRYTESELMAAVVQSFYTAFIKTDAPVDEMPFNEVGPTGDISSSRVRSAPEDYAMGPGLINVMKPGESLELADPKRPNSGFPAFMRAMAIQVGASLEEPADLLLKEFNSSYSASRAALLEAWKAFRMRREWLVSDLCRPTYSVWMAEAVARGRIIAPGFFTSPIIRAAYLGSEWVGPSQGQLDPVKEVTAEILACEAGFSTHEQSTIRINGGEFDRNVEQLQRENEKLQRARTPLEGEAQPPSNQLAGMVVKAVLDSLKEGDGTIEQQKLPGS